MTAAKAAKAADGRAAATLPDGTPAIEARLYDARGGDRPIDIVRKARVRLRNDQLLWIDVDGRDGPALEAAGRAVGLDPGTVAELAETGAALALRRHDEYVHLGLRSAQPGEKGAIDIVALDLVVARNAVITVATVRGGLRAVSRRDRWRDQGRPPGRHHVHGRPHRLDPGGYMALVEDLETRVDRLDERALRSRSATPVVAELAVLRGRAAALRRALAPHRPAFAAMARPDFELHEALGRPWPGLLERLDTTLAAVETARDLLIGTFDIVMSRAAQRTNDTVKILTVLSAVLLPASLVAAVLGMNFAMPFFQDLANFWWALGGMAVLMAVTLVVALTRDRE